MGSKPGGRGSNSAGVGPYLVAGLRAGQGWGQGQFECCCHQAAPQQAPQSPPEEQLPLQLHSQVQTPLWCSLSLQDMMYWVKQTLSEERKHLLARKVAMTLFGCHCCAMLKHFMYGVSSREGKTEKTTPVGANLMRSQALYWAAQVSFKSDFMVRSGRQTGTCHI